MKKQSLVMILVVILFASCNKSNETPENESLVFSFHRGGSWIGLNENLKITQNSTHYSISYRDLQTSEEISYQMAIKTSHEQWEFLTKVFDWRTFIKIQDGSCRSCLDGFDEIFSVTEDDETYSFSNGDNDEHFKQMQEFFDAMIMQANIFNMRSLSADGCGSFCVYKSGYEIGIAVTGNREKLNLSETEKTFDLSKTNVADLLVEINNFTPGSHGIYCDCVLEGEVLDTWISTEGTVKIKIVQDYDNNLPAFEKPYIINVIVENVILKNSKGNTLVISQMEFNNVTVGWFPG